MTDIPDPFGPAATQVDMLAALLDVMPGQNPQVKFAIPPKSRRPWAQALVERGVRVHPDLMRQFPIPGDQPGMGPLNPHKWVSREEYDRHHADRPDPAQQQQAMRAALEAMDPSLAARIKDVATDPAKRDALAKELSGRIPGLADRIDDTVGSLGEDRS